MSIYEAITKAEFDSVDDHFNIHRFEFDSVVPTLSQLQEATDHISDSYKTRLQGYLTSAWAFRSVEWRRIDVGNLPSQQLTPTSGVWSGTGTGDRMPNQLCLKLDWTAPTAFPRTCRSYVSGFTEVVNDAAGRPNSTLTGAGAFLAGDLDSFSISTGTVNVYKVAVHFGGTPRVVTASNRVGALTPKNVWFIQRNRRPGVGS